MALVRIVIKYAIQCGMEDTDTAAALCPLGAALPAQDSVFECRWSSPRAMFRLRVEAIGGLT